MIPERMRSHPSEVNVFSIAHAVRPYAGRVITRVNWHAKPRPGELIGMDHEHMQVEHVCWPDGREYFLAMSGDLREILETPLLHHARERAEQEQRHQRQHLQRRLEVEVAAIQRFERAPWWRRIFIALKGKL